jgi:hypothetical protein
MLHSNGRLQALPSKNVQSLSRQIRDKRSSLLVSSVSDEEKNVFETFRPRAKFVFNKRMG